jgi:hypothetical protein
MGKNPRISFVRHRVTQALQAYAALTTSASRGAVRDVSRIQK